MSERILHTTEDGRGQMNVFQDRELKAVAVVKESLTVQFSRRCVEHDCCVIAEETAKESSVDAYRRP